MGVPFFWRGILTSYSCSDDKGMDKKTWCTCKVVVFLTKIYCFFCHSCCRRGRRIRFLKLTRLEGWSTMAGKLFSIKPILGYHIVHMTAFAAWSSGGVKVRSLLFHVFFFNSVPRFGSLSTQRSIVLVERYFIFLYVNVSNKTKIAVTSV